MFYDFMGPVACAISDDENSARAKEYDERKEREAVGNYQLPGRSARDCLVAICAMLGIGWPV